MKLNYWKNSRIHNNSNMYAANETIFRLLGQNKFYFKNKDVLDLGMGTGSNLLEFKKRGSNIYGVDIRKKIVDEFAKKHNLKKNFFSCDLNTNFPKFSIKFDLVFSKDTFFYINKKNHLNLLNEIYNSLNINGLFIFQYPQAELKKMNNDIFTYNLSKEFKKLKKYHDKKNPVIFFSNRYVLSLLNKTKFNLITSIFDVNTYSHTDPHKISINRYLLLEK